MSSVKYVKLNCGDDFIAQTELSADQLTLIVRNPVRLIVLQQKPQENGIAVVPYLPFSKISDDGLEISLSQVLFTTDVEEEIEDGYLKQVEAERLSRSGLVLPESALGGSATIKLN